jgi:hypothetical protein
MLEPEATRSQVVTMFEYTGARVALVDRSDLVEEVRQEAGAGALTVNADLDGFAAHDCGGGAGASAASTS